MEITKVLGTVAMVPKGEYDAEEYYEYLNVVTYNGSSYMARKSSHGVLPTNDEYWQLVAQKAARTYQSVADMKSDDDLKEGMVAETLGYYEPNDGVNTSFIIETASGNEVDGKNDCFILDNGLIAKRIKTKNNLLLSPNISSDEEIKNLHIINESTSSGTAGITFSGQENVIASNNNIEGGYWAARIGNENDASVTKNIKLFNNKLTSPHGISLRHKLGSNLDDNGSHTIAFNEINNTANNPGIESWAINDNILFNEIKNISGTVGGTGGITVGGKNYNIVDGNKVDNFKYGIEIGNSKLNIISNCIIRNCDTGIICSSSPTSEILIDNCIVISPTNGRGIEFAGSSAHRIKISNCIFIFGDTVHGWNDTNSRTGAGIYATSGGYNVNFDNCSFINYNQVQCYGNMKFTNCGFYNCNNIYANRDASFVNCIFKDSKINVNDNQQGLYVSFENCMFELSDAITIFGNHMINGSNGIVKFTNCNTKNCDLNCQVSNGAAGNNDIRFTVQFIDGIGYTYNRGQLSDIVTVLSNYSQILPEGTKIIDKYNHKVWEVMPQGRQISYQSSVPTTGAFVKGDRIYNDLSSSSTVDYWLCTTTGEFGTDTEPVFVAHNI